MSGKVLAAVVAGLVHVGVVDTESWKEPSRKWM